MTLILCFVLLAFINALFIIGMNRAFYYDNVDGIPVGGDKMILWKLHHQVRQRVGNYWSKPLFSCVWCMASVWSVPVYFPGMLYITGDMSVEMIYGWLIYIPVVSAMAGYLDTKINPI